MILEPEHPINGQQSNTRVALSFRFQMHNGKRKETNLLANCHCSARVVVLFFDHHNRFCQQLRHEARQGLQDSSRIPLRGSLTKCITIALRLHPAHCRLHSRCRVPENIEESSPACIRNTLPCHCRTIPLLQSTFHSSSTLLSLPSLSCTLHTRRVRNPQATNPWVH